MLSLSCLHPVSAPCRAYAQSLPAHTLGRTITLLSSTEEMETTRAEVALLLVGHSQDHRPALDQMRQALYRLYAYSPIEVIDCGDYILDETDPKACLEYAELIHFFLQKNIIPVVLGGTDRLTYYGVQGYHLSEEQVSLSTIDARADLQPLPTSGVDGSSYLTALFEKPDWLSNFALLGYQSYLNDPHCLHLIRDLNYDLMRLGEIYPDLERIRTVLAHTHYLNVDVSAMAYPHLSSATSTNGLSSRELATTLYIAGESPSLSALSIRIPLYEIDARDRQMMAEGIITFLESIANNQRETPWDNPEVFTQETLYVADEAEEIHFYRNENTKHLWMMVEATVDASRGIRRRKHVLCTYHDYDYTFNEKKCPPVWWTWYHKLMRYSSLSE